MEPALGSLVAATTAFVGGHIVMSHPLRAGLIRALGEKGFMGLYSLVSLGAFVWIVLAFRQVGPGATPLWNGQSNLVWIIASLLTLVSLALVIGANKGNPAVPGTGAELVEKAEAQGALAVTRHPMMWGIAVWALAHILVSPTPRTLVTAGGMGLLALLGAHLQDRKKVALLGEAWTHWQAKTSYWPRWGRLRGIGGRVWLVAGVAWLAITWAHLWLAYVPAGIWRWVG